MAGPSDKARYYLEHGVSELNELERKKIFSREEISSIAKKRSDFEHIINARGASTSDFQRYIEFEKNVEALRRKHVKRLGVKSSGSGQKNIFFLYNRGVKKFSGDLELWMQYIEYARKEKAFKKLNEIFTSIVRLHPAKPDVWIYAAEYYMDSQADITNARSYMQRGLRFCQKSEKIWLEYAKLETIYIAKIGGRRKVLGLDIDRTQSNAANGEEEDENMIALPVVSAEDVNPSLGKEDGVDEVALQNMASAPILTGAIPMAIFDAATKQFQGKPAFAERFFDMIAEFDQLSCIERILQHVLDYLLQNYPKSVSTTICTFRMRLFGIHPSSANFISTLRDSLELLASAIGQYPDKQSHIAEVAVRQLLPLLREAEDLDEPTLKKALSASLRKYTRLVEEHGTGASGDSIVDLVEGLVQEKKRADAARLVQASTKQWGTNERLIQLDRALNT
ncbi:hepatocellular carcinoma-associated antigen 66 [Aaosphaeria arxii CBS 175.79]|uniref:Hepatocellular carcinoma-associated antigen 66 n=1 Tax=Aaosphaeria arxii CBS 175.79 TaxID=1450172 RepID=A0A6A5XYI9_9PLEO|nr:hepatocellular carcinoma-associated antigen 66 [Aaosphaeria arxii CBS 175.79]KAF2018375.1 hepatocellular carcinoma-associated antigen 66 [Aaosphaeria arxii CBS 175.79]